MLTSVVFLIAPLLLTQHMDAIVVDTKAVVLECLSYMRTNKVGSATFIPLDAIKVKPLNERLRSLGPR